MDVANKNRFPHLFALDKMKGMDPWERTEEAERYYQEHEAELTKEYEEIMRNEVARDLFGDNKKIHGITDCD